ncbi:MAG: Gfo/Idh/MocA family oxidoreductase [Chloroflexi bacterium]|nr:Gfo/Idh/MocA family oxidoreductase [Chloroflexota bacterium]
MTTYRVGFLGVGPRGLSQARAYMLHPRVEVAALCDVDPERLGAAAAEFGVERTYDDYRAMLDQENLDIVNIPTRTDLHAPLTIGVLEHRAPKAVIVEKPMATSLTDADRMQELAEQNGTRLAIHHQMRTTPTFNVADRLISAGEIGPLTTIKIRGKGYYGGYDMLNIGTHMLNGARRYAGHARSVLATCVTGGRPTTAADIVEGSYGFGLLAGEHISAIYEFDGGLTAFAEMHRRSQPDSGWVHVKIYGEDGAVCLYNSRELFIRRGRDEVVDDTPWEKYELADEDRYLHGHDYYDHAGGDLWMAEETVRVLDEDREHECSGIEGRAVMEMMDGAWVSHFSRSRVDFPLERGEHPLRKELAEAGLPEPDPERGKLRYADWLPGELARIEAAVS